MGLTSNNTAEIKKFINENREEFEERLLQEAINVRDKIDEIRRIGNINLLHNAHKLVIFIVERQTENLVAFAKQEGEIWAKFTLTLSFKLEWVHSIRRTLWKLLQEFDEKSNKSLNREGFFELEKVINEQFDEFLNTFFISYSHYKDELIESQRKLVENLSVPIIPISPTIAILPLIGEIDAYRAEIIEEKVLIEIRNAGIQTLIMDLSGIAKMESFTSHYLLRVLEGTAMMGCEVVITGLRPDIVKRLIQEGITFSDKASLKGTLQQALNKYLIVNH